MIRRQIMFQSVKIEKPKMKKKTINRQRQFYKLFDFSNQTIGLVYLDFLPNIIKFKHSIHPKIIISFHLSFTKKLPICK